MKIIVLSLMISSACTPLIYISFVITYILALKKIKLNRCRPNLFLYKIFAEDKLLILISALALYNRG